MGRHRNENRATHSQIVKYTTGSCFYLAAALHHECGLPLEVALYRTNENANRPDLRPIEGEEPWMCYHCWVVLPNGKRLDIRGEQTYHEITQRILAQCDDNDWSVKVGATSLESLEWVCCDADLSVGQEEVYLALEDAKYAGVLAIARRARMAARRTTVRRREKATV